MTSWMASCPPRGLIEWHTDAGGDNGSAKMWDRREISVSSDDDPSHYLHPHPYARQAEPQWALPCVLPSPEELGPILLPRRAGSDGRSQEVAVLERAMQRLLSNRVEDFVRQWPLVQRSLRTCVTHIMVTLVYYIYVERFGLAGVVVPSFVAPALRRWLGWPCSNSIARCLDVDPPAG